MNDGRTYWDRHATNYDLSMRLFGGPLPRMLDGVRHAVRGADDVLEIAAGTGLATVVIAREAKHVIATDYSTAMLAQLEGRLRDERLGNVEVRQADVQALDFSDASFDSVVATNVLHLVADMTIALHNMTRVLKPGGCLVVPTYCHGQTRRARLVSRGLALTGFPGRRRLTLRALSDSVRSAGLNVIDERLLGGILPIGFLTARR